MNPSDDSLVRAFTATRDPAFRAELAARTAARLRRRRRGRVGTCGHERRVYADNVGAYSSGYVHHADDHSTCNAGYGVDVRWDPPTLHEYLRRQALQSLTPGGTLNP